MSAVFQLARWCVPHRAFKGDFQRCQWMHFAGLSSGYWTFYYYSTAFGSIDLGVIVMLFWDHFKLKTFQIITQSFTEFCSSSSSSCVFDIILQLQEISILDRVLFLSVSKLLHSFKSCTLVWKHCMYSTQFLPCSDFLIVRWSCSILELPVCFVD